MTDFLDSMTVASPPPDRRQQEAARKQLARHALSLADYARLCSMVLADDDAELTYRSWLPLRS